MVKCSAIQNRYGRNNCCLKWMNCCNASQRRCSSICDECLSVGRPLKHCGQVLYESRTKLCNWPYECCLQFKYCLCCCCCIVPCGLAQAVCTEGMECCCQAGTNSRTVDLCSNYGGIVARIVVQELLSLAGPLTVSITFDDKMSAALYSFWPKLLAFGGVYLATSVACFVVFNTVCQPGRWLEWCIDRLVENCHETNRQSHNNYFDRAVNEGHVYDYV